MVSERILVVPREILAEAVPSAFHHKEVSDSALTQSATPAVRPFGEAVEALKALKVMSSTYRFINRDLAERDPSLKQIIPYVVVRSNDRVMLMKRLRRQSEERLWDKYSIGIGGHLNPSDLKEDFFEFLLAGLDRELHEELDVSSNYACDLVGWINDDSNDVGKVHFGLAFQVMPHDGNAKVKETSKMTGEFTAVSELTDYRPQMETWSRILFDNFLSKTG